MSFNLNQWVAPITTGCILELSIDVFQSQSLSASNMLRSRALDLTLISEILGKPCEGFGPRPFFFLVLQEPQRIVIYNSHSIPEIKGLIKLEILLCLLIDLPKSVWWTALGVQCFRPPSLLGEVLSSKALLPRRYRYAMGSCSRESSTPWFVGHQA